MENKNANIDVLDELLRIYELDRNIKGQEPPLHTEEYVFSQDVDIPAILEKKMLARLKTDLSITGKSSFGFKFLLNSIIISVSIISISLLTIFFINQDKHVQADKLLVRTSSDTKMDIKDAQEIGVDSIKKKIIVVAPSIENRIEIHSELDTVKHKICNKKNVTEREYVNQVIEKQESALTLNTEDSILFDKDIYYSRKVYSSAKVCNIYLTKALEIAEDNPEAIILISGYMSKDEAKFRFKGGKTLAFLRMKVVKELFLDCDYTSSRILTKVNGVANCGRKCSRKVNIKIYTSKSA